MAQAEQTCRHSIPEFARLPDPQQLNLPGLARLAEQARKVTKRGKEQLGKATPTRDTAEEYGEFVVHVGTVEKHLEDLKEAARARDLREAEHRLLGVHQSGERAESVARRLALEPCARLAAAIAETADPGSPARGSLSSPAYGGAGPMAALPRHPS